MTVNRETIVHQIMIIGRWFYQRPLLSVVLLALLSNAYLVSDYAVINRSSLDMLWQLDSGFPVVSGHLQELAWLVEHLSTWFSINVVFAGYGLMAVAYTLIAVLMLLIARGLRCSLLTQWALIFLLLSHPSFCDFRSYILIEPIFWVLWLLAVYLLIIGYREHTVWVICAWLVIFLVAGLINIAAWFWLLLFPFGALFWKPWRRRSVSYALLCYAALVAVLLFLPLYQGQSAISYLQETLLNNPDFIANALSLPNNNWVRDGDGLMSGVFVVSGASSLVLIRTLISLSGACLVLLVYAVMKKQYRVLNSDHLRLLIYLIVFDLFISIALLILGQDSESILSFSTCLLLLLFSALGLSYVFKKMATEQYSRLSVLVIVWAMVAYFASGFIIFGPKQEHLKHAGQYFSTHFPNNVVYSNDDYFLFYSGDNPDNTLMPQAAEELSEITDFYYAYNRHRKVNLPTFWARQQPIKRFANRHGDELLIYRLSH